MNLRLEYEQIMQDTALEHDTELPEGLVDELFYQLKELFMEYCGDETVED